MFEIEQLLRRTMGLTAESIGSPAIHRSVFERMATCGVQEVTEYKRRLDGSGGELQELIEQVVVPETSFFRHEKSFVALADIVTSRGYGLSANPMLRVLSAPCSTGEEAYSIAITLLEQGIQRDRLRIDAIDISRRVLAKAKRAVYSANSFRGEDLGFRDRYCQATPDGYALVDSVRDAVHFYQANLIGVESLLREEGNRYDIVFCRNLLIYLDRPAQELLMQTLHGLLTPDGYLFVGPAEATLASECGFDGTEHRMAFAFCKSSAGSAPRRQKSDLRSRDAARAPGPRIAPKPSAPKQPVVTRLASPAVKPAISQKSTHQVEAQDDVKEQTDLTEARALADAGRLQEAAQMCEALLRKRSVSVEGHYLLAVVRDALGDKQQAVAQYRKVLFLAPGHKDAAAHLALLTRAQGDVANTEQLQRRARRIERRER